MNKKLAEMQLALCEQIGSLRADMNSKVQALEKKAAADDDVVMIQLQQLSIEARFKYFCLLQ